MSEQFTVEVDVEYLPNFDLTKHPNGMEYQTEGASGFDLVAAIARPVTFWVGDTFKIPLGFKIALPRGYELQLRPRSGLSTKSGLMMLNSIGTIDSDYRDEVMLVFGRTIAGMGGDLFVAIQPGERIGQGIVASVERAKLNRTVVVKDTARVGGFGSTGT